MAVEPPVSGELAPEAPPAPAAAPKQSGVEVVKENSRQLRGSIVEELARDSGPFSEADKNLLKFHGTYQQEDRDARKARRARGLRQALHVHGPLQDPGRPRDGRPIPGPR